jgi:hypothetical protein
MKQSNIERKAQAELRDIGRSIEADLKAGFTYVLSIPANPHAERKTSELVACEAYSDKIRVVPARLFKIKTRPA